MPTSVVPFLKEGVFVPTFYWRDLIKWTYCSKNKKYTKWEEKFVSSCSNWKTFVFSIQKDVNHLKKEFYLTTWRCYNKTSNKVLIEKEVESIDFKGREALNISSPFFLNVLSKNCTSTVSSIFETTEIMASIRRTDSTKHLYSYWIFNQKPVSAE